MTETMTIDLRNELQNYVESLVTSGEYRSNSEVLKESLGLLRKKQVASKIKQLRELICEGEESGEPLIWDVDKFFNNNERGNR